MAGSRDDLVPALPRGSRLPTGAVDDLNPAAPLRSQGDPGVGRAGDLLEGASSPSVGSAGNNIPNHSSPAANTPSSLPSRKTQKIFDSIQEGIESGDFSVTRNHLNPDTLQETNVTIDFGGGRSVNLRTETHPLVKGGDPIRHTNVEALRRNARGNIDGFSISILRSSKESLEKPNTLLTRNKKGIALEDDEKI